MCESVKMEILIYLILCLCCVHGFNVDIPSCVKHKGPTPGSMFGFSVAEHSENGRKRILVGAPEDDTFRRRGIIRPGAVYECDTVRENYCTEIVFDFDDNTNDTQGRQIDEKSYEWFGATITSAGIDGPVVACAPRYVSYVTAKLSRRDPVGTCFVAKNNFRDVNEYSPCRTQNHGHNRNGFCQAGFGAAISKDGRRLFMGAPGSWYWQGQVYAQSLDSRQVFLSTNEASPKYDDTYLGYSVVAGDFVNSGEQGLAVGMPKGEMLRGMVLIYTWDLVNVKNISGAQIGAYFGYCLAAGDIDNDGLDDLLIGAPMYTEPNNEGSFETGRIYVVYQGRSQIPFKIVHSRAGSESRGRFGLSLTYLRDINLDGFGDFAVGAPYAGPNGRGVVYIFHGGKDGVREKPSQIITAEDVGIPISTFGFSLSGGIDLDENQYTDLVVGAYKSDMAIFFKSRPVVRMTASVEYEGAKLISLEKKDCTLRSGEKVACATFKYCLQYDGINVDRQIEFDLVFTLDTQTKRNSRLFFLRDEQSSYKQSLTLARQQMECGKASVYVMNEPRDKLTPLEVSLTYNLRSDTYRDLTSPYIPPVLDMNLGNVQKDFINIQKNCGPDNVCIPDLRMQVTPSVDRYLLDSNEKLGINVFVENNGEDAFEASYFLSMPPGVHFVRTDRLETNKSKISVLCSSLTHNVNANNTLKCDIGNPLPANDMVNFRIVLQPYHIAGMGQSYDFAMEVNSTNNEHQYTAKDNYYKLSVGMSVSTNISLSGSSNPPDLHYNASIYKTENITHENDIGPAAVHIYEIKNNGPSSIEEANIYILWPYQTLKGDDFFYVLVQPETSGPIQCEMADHVNDKHVIVTDPLKSYIRIGLSETAAEDNINIQVAGASAATRTAAGSTSAAWTAQSTASASSGSRVSADRIAQEEENFAGESGDASLIHAARASSAAHASSSSVYSRTQSRPSPDMDWSRPPVVNENGDRTQFQASSASRGSGASYYDSQGRFHLSREVANLGHEGESGSSFNNRYGNQNYGNQGYGSQTVHNATNIWNNNNRHSWSTEETVNKDIMNIGSGSYYEGSLHSDAGTTYVGEAEDAVGLAAVAGNQNGQFITNALDLGTLDSSAGNHRQNDYRSTQSGNQAGQGSYQSSQSIHQSGQVQQQAGGGAYGNVHPSGRSGFQGYQSGNQAGGSRSYESHGSSYSAGASSRASSYSSGANQYSSSHSSFTDRPSQPIRWKRELRNSSDELRPIVENCTANFKCVLVRCATTGTLKAGQAIYLALRARINANVLKQMTEDQTLIMSSLVAAKISRLPYIGQPEHERLNVAEAKTKLVPQLSTPTEKSIPLWVIILAAIVGAILLLLLIFLLYKCGFFKRNRPSDSAERAPLNRNGYGRDEPL